jgi:hypothetical protein
MQVKWEPPSYLFQLSSLPTAPSPPYTSAKPILDDQRSYLPAELQNVDPARRTAWSQKEGKAIRARLQQGDLDSMVNLLLLGTSFAKQPGSGSKNIGKASKRRQ